MIGRVIHVLKKILKLVVLTLSVMVAVYLMMLFYDRLVSGYFLEEGEPSVTDWINILLVCLSLGLAFWGFKIAGDAARIADKANDLASKAALIAEKANELAADEAEANRQHNMLSVKPYLEIYVSGTTGDESIKITFHNNGLGPAIFKKIAFQYDEGEIFDSINYIDPFYSLCEKIESLAKLDRRWDSFTENTAISVGSANDLITLMCNKDFDAKQIRQIIRKLDIKIYYSDIYLSYEDSCSADCLKKIMLTG